MPNTENLECQPILSQEPALSSDRSFSVSAQIQVLGKAELWGVYFQGRERRPETSLGSRMSHSCPDTQESGLLDASVRRAPLLPALHPTSPCRAQLLAAAATNVALAGRCPGFLGRFQFLNFFLVVRQMCCFIVQEFWSHFARL